MLKSSSPTTRIQKAIVIALALVSMLAAALVPACGDAFCCPTLPEAPMLHADMPCCASTSFAPREIARVQPSTTSTGAVSSPRIATPVAVIAQSHAPLAPARLARTIERATTAHLDPTPPLFLLNAQFLI